MKNQTCTVCGISCSKLDQEQPQNSIINLIYVKTCYFQQLSVILFKISFICLAHESDFTNAILLVFAKIFKIIIAKTIISNAILNFFAKVTTKIIAKK